LTRGSIKEFIRLQSDKIKTDRPPEFENQSTHGSTAPSSIMSKMGGALSMKEKREANNLKKELETRKSYEAFVKN